MSVTPLETIAVGVIVERTKGMNQWTDFLWRPTDVLPGAPQMPAWTQLSGDEARAQFYAGAATIELYRSETPNYRENLTSGEPKLWVVLRPGSGEPPLELLMVTADPAEGEAMTEAGNDIVQPVAMPETVRAVVETFIADNPFERVHIKRKRERADPESLARRLVPREEGK